MLEHFELHVFKFVAKNLNFSKAATEVGLSAPQVTKIISSLEEKLKTKLFHRTTRYVRLTREGEAFLLSALKTLDSIKETSNFFETIDDPKNMTGLLRITAPNTLGLRMLPSVLKSYSNLFPKIQIQVLLADHYLDFAEDEIDLALRITKPQDSSLVARKLVDNPVSFYASPKYLEKYPEPIHIAELRNHKVLCIPIHLKLKFINSKLSLQQIIPAPNVFCTNGDLLVELACLGDGLLIRSEWGVEKEVKDGKLIKIHLDDQLYSETAIYLVYPKHKYTNFRIKALIDIFIKHFKN